MPPQYHNIFNIITTALSLTQSSDCLNAANSNPNSLMILFSNQSQTWYLQSHDSLLKLFFCGWVIFYSSTWQVRMPAWQSSVHGFKSQLDWRYSYSKTSVPLVNRLYIEHINCALSVRRLGCRELVTHLHKPKISKRNHWHFPPQLPLRAKATPHSG